VLTRCSSRRFSPNAARASSRRCLPSEVPLPSHRRAPCAANFYAGASSATTSLQSSNLQGDIVLKAHVTSVCFKCFRCFIWMSHVSHLDIAKVDRDVAIAIHVCCNCMFQMFPLFFQTYVASAFVWMLHMFHTYVASVLSGYCICFVIAFHVFLQVLLTL
jgi:hypothetical protein